jgi:hypothetical protein
LSTTLPLSGAWRKISVNTNSGRYVSVSTIGAIYSDDGITWNSSDLPGGANWSCVTFNPVSVRYVILRTNNSNVYAYSTDGATWTSSTLPGWAPGYQGYQYWSDVTSGALVPFVLNSGYTGIGVSTPSYQLDLSTDNARKLTTNSWLTGSDRRIKMDIVSANLSTCYEAVKAINLKYFKWTIPVDDQHSLGFIAQEVREVFPNAVLESDSFGYPDFLSLNTDQILKAMYGALQKTMNDIENLKTRLSNINKIPRLNQI